MPRMIEGASGTFAYANPRRVHWGAGTLERALTSELSRLGVQRVFVVSTKSVANNPALGGRLRSLLGDRLVGEYSAIGQHAPAAAVADAVEAAREAQPDVLVSFGGGSPIDAAKTVAFALATGLDLRDADAAGR